MQTLTAEIQNAKKTMVARHWREMLTLSYFVGASARLLKFSNEPFPIDNEILYCDACHNGFAVEEKHPKIHIGTARHATGKESLEKSSLRRKLQVA